ncbi:curli production assembly/transport protein CsgE [Polaribacter litorisediminis]|uniref:curli production assembly/transport protein CsgE n=1 Tax=Polaribacter litorisediminis TaxID=1908341 RepID=UPI001CBC35CD|nr:curli production assembly/transport protein CsgE [Polaribacter litorisediminis]UAM99143.1 curli production assembly/transport protein CsgE [Polaribacter litorisediminis]
MFHLKIILLSIFALFFSAVAFSQRKTNTKIEAIIDTIPTNETYIIKSLANNKLNESKLLKYKFTIIRKNIKTKNILHNNQSGNFTLEPGEIKMLSQTAIKINKDDSIIILLLIYDKDELLGKSRVVIGVDTSKIAKGKKKENSNNESKHDVEFKGIVTDLTKTKFGHEFYEAFSNTYRQSNLMGNGVISIEEKFIGIGLRTLIDVKIENVTIYRFFVQPDLEYLTNMSDHVLILVQNHFERKKKNKNNMQQY